MFVAASMRENANIMTDSRGMKAVTFFGSGGGMRVFFFFPISQRISKIHKVFLLLRRRFPPSPPPSLSRKKFFKKMRRRFSFPTFESKQNS